MKIIHGNGTPISAPELHALPAPDMGRVEALEKIAKTILQKLQMLEERVAAAEKEPAPTRLAPVSAALSLPVTPITPIASLNSDAVKKGLLTKMWKYLNDAPSAKAA
jgi:hypothetical protein